MNCEIVTRDSVIPGFGFDQSVRGVLDALLQDMTLDPIEPASLPWDAPILILRSAPMDRLAALLADICQRTPGAVVHVLSHARDGDAVRALSPEAIFHPYPTPGRYRLEDVPPATLESLRAVGFGVLLFLDPGTSSGLFDEAERLFAAIADRPMISVREDEGFARARDSAQRRRAQAAFLALVDWYQRTVDPAFGLQQA